MFIRKYGDYIVGCVFGLLGIALLVAARMLPASRVMEIGPDFMPTVVGLLMVILSAILLVQTAVGQRREKLAAAKKENAAGEKAGVGGKEAEAEEPGDYRRVGGSLVLSLLYVFLLQPVGFIVSTLVYLFCQIFVLAPDERRTGKDVVLYLVLDLAFTMVVYFLFRYGFKIVLPTGIFAINL